MTDERQARIDAITSDLARPWQEVERAVETARWLLAELDAATARAEEWHDKAMVMAYAVRDQVSLAETHIIARQVIEHGAALAEGGRR